MVDGNRSVAERAILALIADFGAAQIETHTVEPGVEERIGDGFEQLVREKGSGGINEEAVRAGRLNSAARDVLKRFDSEQHLPKTAEVDEAVEGAKDERGEVVGRVTTGGVETNVLTRRQVEVINVIQSGAIDRRRRVRHGYQSG